MKLLILASVLVAAVSAAPGRSYGQPRQSYDGPAICGNGQVLHLDGSCVTPKVHRQVFVFTPPHRPREHRPPPSLPTPEVITNIVFIRVPEEEDDVEDIVVPPPRQKNVVYVLNKRKPDDGPRLIEVPAGPPSNPEVYFVNYRDGENPQLPGGLDLQSALNKAAHAGGRIIGGGDDDSFSIEFDDGSFGSDFDDDFNGSHGGGISQHYGVP
ncbi:uncharacterized protein LOC127003272 [Eriocheir sinensis]|uniref:uncharacterized protein LOC127003272 n=1 Tax=Eriocheir sinensis TaxID=95602 RepID=UPI0021C876B4|nr:uncharacterized protein LOC127003272 [Eriocheir sinensis]